jgi:hypothetical protein
MPKREFLLKFMFAKENLFGDHPSPCEFLSFLNSNGSKTNKSSGFHKIYLHLLFQRKSLWSELKVVKAATISIYPTVSEDFAEAGGGLTIPQWSHPLGGLASARSRTTAIVFKE